MAVRRSCRRPQPHLFGPWLWPNTPTRPAPRHSLRVDDGVPILSGSRCGGDSLHRKQRPSSGLRSPEISKAVGPAVDAVSFMPPWTRKATICACRPSSTHTPCSVWGPESDATPVALARFNVWRAANLEPKTAWNILVSAAMLVDGRSGRMVIREIPRRLIGSASGMLVLGGWTSPTFLALPLVAGSSATPLHSHWAVVNLRNRPTCANGQFELPSARASKMSCRMEIGREP